MNRAALAVLLAGCAAPVRVVSVEGPTRRGSGVVLGPRCVATVEHVVDWPMTAGGALVTRVVWLPATGERIALLRTAADMPGPYAAFADGAGSTIHTPRGPTPVRPCGAIPGDSGSPVVGQLGVVGLHRKRAYLWPEGELCSVYAVPDVEGWYLVWVLARSGHGLEFEEEDWNVQTKDH